MIIYVAYLIETKKST